MHSSRMRTGRTLTVFQGRRPPPENLEEPPLKIWRYPPRKFGGTPPKKTPPENLEVPPKKRHNPTPPKKYLEVPPQKKTPPQKRHPPEIWRYPPKKTPPKKRHPPVNRITHTCKNITLAKTSFRPVIIQIDLNGSVSCCHLVLACCNITIFCLHSFINGMQNTRYCLK